MESQLNQVYNCLSLILGQKTVERKKKFFPISTKPAFIRQISKQPPVSLTLRPAGKKHPLPVPSLLPGGHHAN